MDSSSASASTLARSRLALAIISAAAAVTVGIYLLREASWAAHHPHPDLHRSNAIRRPRRPTRTRRNSTASTTSAESNAVPDENRDESEELAVLNPVADGDTVAEESMGNHLWDEIPQRAGQNIVSLLFRVSEDNARRNAYVHRGCACNACGTVPIRGIRYRCANCADFDLCETCESQGMHIKTHIFYKVKIPAPPFGPRQMQPVFYTGDPDTCLRNLPRQLMVKLSQETGYERPELEAFWEQWTYIANTEWRDDPDDLCLAMDRKTFERCLVPSGGYRHTAPNLLHDRMFAFYDTNNDDLIGFSEFLHGLSYRKRKDKLKRIFDGYDVDGDGYVDRRDFLRLFRAHYVLFKQMHKDILEGLDDQVMSSTEAHQLVTSRQPLSGLFGREGRVPDPDLRRHLEGKVFHSNGDVALSGGRDGVVNEDKPDTAGREEILSNLFNRTSQAQSPTSTGQSGWRYFDILLNPPRTTEELQAVINEEPRATIDSFLHAHDEGEGVEDEENGDSRENGAASVEEVLPSDTNGAADHRSVEASGLGGSGTGNHGWSRINFHSQRGPINDDVATDSRESYMHDVDIHHRSRVNRKSRIAARKKLYERWKRRQFYLDEEEGAHAPEGWNPSDDILANRNGVSEGSHQHHQRPALSPRSRSSSKVRFAEDTDDYEIRSNPSTSSRSVPERWGGMEIPDAERDAGKEILYQVTQQAFNELLDVLFKKKEDLAIKVASSRAERNRYRKYFESIELQESEHWKHTGGPAPAASGSAAKAAAQAEPPTTVAQPIATTFTAPPAPTIPASDGDAQREWVAHTPSRISAVSVAVATSGFSHQQDSPTDQVSDDSSTNGIEEILDDTYTLQEEDVQQTEVHAQQDTDNVPTAEQQGETGEEEPESREPQSPSKSGSASPSECHATTSSPVHLDPTMPQFRPNTADEVVPYEVQPSGNMFEPGDSTVTEPADEEAEEHENEKDEDEEDEDEEEEEDWQPASVTPKEPSQDGNDDDEEDFDENEETPVFPRSVLEEWKRLDLAEREYEERRGWGKLSYQEFEEIYRREERHMNRLDYLGSWIDFCIPY